jgi:hypothetical protein
VPNSDLQPKSKETQNKATRVNGVQAEGASLSVGQPFAAAERARLDSNRLTSHDVIALQRSVGNQVVARMLGSGAAQSRRGPVIQAKLTVGPAHDKYEQEADDVANRVMRMTDPAPHQDVTKPQADAEQVQRAPVINRVQRRTPVGLEGGAVDSGLETTIHQAKNGGSSLSSGLRSKLEPKLNADLSGVKIHTDSKAVQLNRDLGAKAFTHKNHIFYGAGQSPNDVKLTAHEAVHTIQQGAVPQKSVQRKRRDQGQERGEAGTGETTVVEQGPAVGVVERSAIGDTIQRSVGFEFQTTWGIVKNEPAPPTQLTKTQKVGKAVKSVGKAIAKPFKAIGKAISNKINGPQPPVVPTPHVGPVPPDPGRQHTRFPKAMNHITDGYVNLSTDDASTVLGSEIEWVIDPPIPDNATDKEVTAIINRLMHYINALLALNNQDSFRLSAITGRISDDEVEIQPGAKSNAGRAMDVSPQTTGGIKFEHLFDMLKEVAGGKNGTSEFNGGTGTSRAEQMTSRVNTAKIDGSPQLKGLLAFIVNYMNMNKSLGPNSDPYKFAADYAKVNTQFLLRTDFATMFNLLPKEEKQKYTKNGTQNADTFVNLVKSVMPDIDMNGQVFERGVKNTSNKTVKYFPLTRKQWLQGIAEGEDKLSGASAFAKAQGYAGDLESMGNINGKAGKLDQVGRDDPSAKTGIIMEFRSKTDQIKASDIPGYIRTTFNYIQQLNQRKTQQEIQDDRLKEDSHKRRAINFWG